jgi:cytochrome c oxidase accessory protein FixG
MPTCESQVQPVVHQYHRVRKSIHLICFLIFAALPFFNLMRFDIPRQRFYVFGFELWISEFGIIFFSLMFLMFVIIGSSVLYGRVYCGYLCPQMIFSEASLAVENWLTRKVTKHFGAVSVPNRKRVARVLFYLTVALASVVPAFIFISYFVEPRDLLGRLFALDIRTAGGIAGAVVTLVTFLDFTLVRQRFCTTVCPYGYLQGMLGDKNTLLIHYRDPAADCIQCKKCVRVCHMGIDIRDSPFQIECVHCGECIDACDQIMARLGKPGLIHYAWGEGGSVIETEKSWYRKLGMRDAKRVVVALVTLFYLSGLLTALSMRRAVLVQLSPERATLYRLDDRGVVHNRFRVKVSNRSSQGAAVTFTVEGLPGAWLEFEANPVVVGPAGTAERHFEVAAGSFPASQEVNHFRIVAKAAPGREQDTFDETFLMPPERK